MHTPPFHYEDMNLVRDGILNHEPYPIPPYYSTELRGLITRMMSKSPEERPDCDAILQLPFIQKEVLKLPWGRAQTTPAAQRPIPDNDALAQSQKAVAGIVKRKEKKKDKKESKSKGA